MKKPNWLQMITPKFADDLIFALYDEPVSYSWRASRYTKGSYSYIPPGQESLLTAIHEEKGEKAKILFAGIEQKLYLVGQVTSVLKEVLRISEGGCEFERCVLA